MNKEIKTRQRHPGRPRQQEAKSRQEETLPWLQEILPEHLESRPWLFRPLLWFLGPWPRHEETLPQHLEPWPWLFGIWLQLVVVRARSPTR